MKNNSIEEWPSQHGNAENKKQKTKHHIDFWLASSFEFERLDELSGDVSIKFFSKWWWLSATKLKVTNDELTGEEVFDDEHNRSFPVNPSMPFLNIVSTRRLRTLSSAKCIELPENSTARNIELAIGGRAKYLVQAQKVYRAVIRTQLDMRQYPFDRHLIAAVLAVRKRKEEGKSCNWRLLREIPRHWFNESDLYPEDTHVVSLQCQWLDPADELQSLTPLVAYKRFNVNGEIVHGRKPALCIRLEREPSIAIFNIVVPTFVIVNVVMMSFFVSWVFKYRMMSVSKGLLTLVTLQLYLNDKLPKKCYTTYASKYWIAVYLFLFLMGLKLVFMNAFLIHRSPMLIFTETDVSAQYVKHLDSLLSILALIIWWIPHVYIFTDYVGIHQSMRKRFRIPWSKICIKSEIWKFGQNNDDFLYRELISNSS